MWILLVVTYICACSTAHSAYYLQDSYNSGTFLSMFEFYSGGDPVNGYVNFLNYTAAKEEGLFKILENNSIYIGVDSTNVSDVMGRKSIRLHSKQKYNRGLFILDLDHMPEGVCGVWSMFWLLDWGQVWPQGGEIHAIEGTHTINYNKMFLLTKNSCYIQKANDFTGNVQSLSCMVDTPGQNIYGCLIDADRSDSFGAGFNQAGGGVYSIERTSNGMKIWYFTRSNIPDNIKQDTPDPTKWPNPVAEFAGDCDFDSEFYNHTLIIATTFCGFRGEQIWAETCEDKCGISCPVFVQNNPGNFTEIYWLINSLKVFYDPILSAPAAHSSPQFSTTTTLKMTPSDSTQNTSPSGKKSKSSIALFLAIFIPICAIIIVLCILFCWCRLKQKKRLESIYALARNSLQIFKKNWVEQRFDDNLWEISRENVVINRENKLGVGSFADVYSGKLIGDSAIKRVYKDTLALTRFCNCDVAVKVLPPNATEASKLELQKEINFMKSLKYHTHLVCLLGCVSDTLSPLLVLELCANGDLLKFVQTNKDLFINGLGGFKFLNLISYAWQVCDGLEYLTSLKLVHRDVAARNVLLDRDNVCKIGDFGLCRLTDNEIYTSRGGRLPVRWMAIESLKRLEYSQKTDVWAYGVLLYEIFSFGETPYAGLTNSDILSFLESGKRLQKPVFCTNEVYNLMLNCWQFEASARPTFTEISSFLTQLLDASNPEYDYIEAVMPSLIFLSESTPDGTLFE